MKDCACVYRIYIGKNKEKAQERLIEKYQEFVALGAKEITLKVDENTIEGGNGPTYPYRPFEKTMNYIIRPVSEKDDNNSDTDGKEDESKEESGIDGNHDGKEKEPYQQQDIEKEKGVDNIQEIRDFYSKSSSGVVCICVV